MGREGLEPLVWEKPCDCDAISRHHGYPNPEPTPRQSGQRYIERSSRPTVNTSKAISAAHEMTMTRREISPPSGTQVPLESAGEGFEFAECSESPAALPDPVTPVSPESNRAMSATTTGSEVAASHRA